MAMIGNVPTDQSHPVDTKAILRAIPTNVFIYANGRAQFRHSREEWGDSLARINCLQFSLREAKSFASVLNGRDTSTINEAIKTFLRQELNVIVTLGRMGAISVFGQMPELGELVFLTWPTMPNPPAHMRATGELPTMLDPTGAGDAFGAGFVASIAHDLIRNEKCLHTERLLEGTLLRALDTGAMLGSWACCGFGGRSICPSERGSITPFIGHATGATSTRKIDEAENLLYAIDR